MAEFDHLSLDEKSKLVGRILGAIVFEVGLTVASGSAGLAAKSGRLGKVLDVLNLPPAARNKLATAMAKLQEDVKALMNRRSAGNDILKTSTLGKTLNLFGCFVADGFNPHFREFGGEELAADPVSYPPKTGSCGSCQSAVKSLADLTLEHCDKLRELAAQAASVVEFGMRHGVSTVALLVGQPKQMISYDLHQDPVAELLKSRQEAAAVSFVQGDSMSVDIEPCDLLFIDRPRTDLDRTQMPRCLQR